MVDPNLTQIVLGVALALHLAHHRLAHRHISFVEVFAAGLLTLPTTQFPLPIAVAHLGTVAVLAMGSLSIRKLSPAWDERQTL